MGFLQTAKLSRRVLGLYSTTATPIGVWTDGRRVFRKVLSLAAGPNNETVNAAHGLTVTDVHVTRLDVILTKTSDKTVVLAPNISTDEAHSLSLAMGTTNISLTSGSGGDYSGYTGKIILEYALTES